MFQVQVQEEGVYQGLQEVARQPGAQDHRARFQENDQVLQSHQGHCSHSGTNQNQFFFCSLELTKYNIVSPPFRTCFPIRPILISNPNP